MAHRQEFIALAQQEGANVRALCRRFGISPTTGYKWLNRVPTVDRSHPSDLEDRSRRPHTSPTRTDPAVETQVLALRQQHPAWGGRKLAARLHALGVEPVPHPNTITAILRRHDQLGAPGSRAQQTWQRFEAAAPNTLWQMDFKGHLPLGASGLRCHPLTVLDDHSRFAVGLIACPDEQRTTVQSHLITLFRQYGLPDRMLADNGPPWGDPGHGGRFSRLGVWLLRLGVGLSHGRPLHPQTQGKDERFHRTLLAEAVRGRVFGDLVQAQHCFDAWRDVYNLERPHEACGLQPPISRYQLSARAYPETLPPVEYGPEDVVRKVHGKGEIFFHGRVIRVSAAFHGEPVAIRPLVQDGCFGVYYARHRLTTFDLRQPVEPVP